MYFHNAQYERIARIPFSRVKEGDPLQVLPAIRQLHPEIEVRYEEDSLDLAAGPGQWVWLLVPGRIYLVGPDGRVYHSPNITSLLRVYLDSRAGAAGGADVLPADPPPDSADMPPTEPPDQSPGAPAV